MNEIGHYVWLDAFEWSVDIDNVSAGIFDKVICIVDAHGDYNLLI